MSDGSEHELRSRGTIPQATDQLAQRIGSVDLAGPWRRHLQAARETSATSIRIADTTPEFVHQLAGIRSQRTGFRNPGRSGLERVPRASAEEGAEGRSASGEEGGSATN